MNWKSLVKSVAPTLATALGGPLAGMGVKVISEAILGKPDGDESEIEAALVGATPEMLHKLKTADHKFKLEMGKYNIDLKRIEKEDRDSARQRQVATMDKTPAILAYILTVGFLGALVMLYIFPIPEENEATIYIMLGSLGTAWVASMAYFHGTTSSSKRKDVLISEKK